MKRKRRSIEKAMAMCSSSSSSSRMGGMAGFVYRALSATIAPLLFLHLKYRRIKGLEHDRNWTQRLGSASIARPPGPLLWFHAVSVGEGLSAIPVIQKCLQARPLITILMTTSTVTAFTVLEQTLPPGVLFQFAPIDTPTAVNKFLAHWQPQAAVFMENELWPNLLSTLTAKETPLALLNARMSLESFKRWSFHGARPLVASLLASFSLICPLSTTEAVRLQLLGAPPNIIHFAGNLKYAWGDLKVGDTRGLEKSLSTQLIGRKVWLAASTHAGEEEVIGRVHKNLMHAAEELLTVIVPRHPHRGYRIQMDLIKMGLNVARRSLQEDIQPETDIYVADTIGPHIGHFSRMVSEMRQHSDLSITQVSGQEELQFVLNELLTDPVYVKQRQEAAKYVSASAAVGLVDTVWKLLEQHVLGSVFGPACI